jgi:hypothetical protein
LRMGKSITGGKGLPSGFQDSTGRITAAGIARDFSGGLDAAGNEGTIVRRKLRWSAKSGVVNGSALRLWRVILTFASWSAVSYIKFFKSTLSPD